MSNIAAITVYDGAATPVSHSLAAIEVSRKGNGINSQIEAYWREQLASVPTEAQVSVRMKMATLKNRSVRVEVLVEVPVMETVTNQNAAGYTAAPKVAYVDKIQAIMFHHPRSSITSRRLTKQILANLLNNISTSVAAATTGPVSELLDSQVMST